MKKIITQVFAAFLLVFAFAASPALAQEAAVTTQANTDNPRINIEFENFPEEGDFEGDVYIDDDSLGEVALGVGGIFAGLGMLMFLLVAVAIGLFVMWIVMIVHAAQHPVPNKVVWIVIMVLTGWLGSILYYFIVKRPFDRHHEVTINVVKEDSADTQ
jgi:hypothetical protein